MNCENNNTRRPSLSSSSSISSSAPSLPLSAWLPLLSTPLTRRRSQHTWRSLSNASRITIWLRAAPLRAISSRTFWSMATRTASYVSRWASLSSTQCTISVLAGSSVATCSLVRRSRNGRMRLARWAMRSLSPWRSIGVR
ncbi:hypothetical protein D3C75_905050 [compost metagenome]